MEPVTVEALVKAFGAGAWTRCVLRDSTRGELRVDMAHRRVWVGANRKARTLWLNGSINATSAGEEPSTRGSVCSAGKHLMRQEPRQII